MKKSLFLSFLLSLSMFSFAQLYVTSSGSVGIGTNTPTSLLQIYSSGKNFTFKINTGGSMEIGAYNGVANTPLTFWHTNAGFNTLTAKAFNKSSDIRLKKNLEPIINSIEILKSINGYSYIYNEKSESEGNLEYGVVAQEVEKTLPELVSTAMGYKVVDYDQFIPFLIEAVKEQQNIIEDLQRKIEKLEAETKTTEKGGTQDINFAHPHTLTVYQNTPNPFNTNTSIQCFIPENVNAAQLCVYDMRGVKVKCFDISERGSVELQIQASSLSAGIYAYTLTGDGQVSDTKQMILTK